MCIRDSYNEQNRETLLEAFRSSYIKAFTRTPPATDVEIINARIAASVDLRDRWSGLSAEAGKRQSLLKGERSAYFPEAGALIPAPVYDRRFLEPGRLHEGPAIVEEAASTLIVGPRGTFSLAENGNIIVDIP